MSEVSLTLGLEAELGQALLRIDELETSVNTRLSLPRSDVLSGQGEAGLEVSGVEVGEEIRDKAARLITQFRGEEDTGDVSVEEAVSVLSDLLIFTDNISSRVKDRVEEVEQQLEVADKQLRATRAFLEEQAAERDTEREEWDRRLATLVTRQRSVRGGETQETSDQESRADDDESSDTPQSRVTYLESELSTAVDKIYELRDIIRGLETKLESKTVSEQQQGEVVRSLKVGLEEALLSQELVTQELEMMRNGDHGAEEIQEHIRSLEEQLRSKSAELSKQRAETSQLQDIRAQLRGLEERVEQRTRELEHSVIVPDTVPAGDESNSSSRVSTPAPAALQLLGSCEDIGTISGMEELSRLEKKIKHLEKAETAAVDRVKLLETENDALKRQTDELQDQLTSVEEKMEGVMSELKVYTDKVQELQKTELTLKKMIKTLEVEKERLEDVESERDVLQERLTHQQMQISSLQSTVESSRHRVVQTSKEEQVTRLMEDRETLRTELEMMRNSVKRLEQDKTSAETKLSEVRQRLLEMESPDSSSSGDNKLCDQCDSLTRDNDELRSVNDKLQTQLSQARAAQLAAQKTELPLLSQKLLDEKNLEIEQLRHQVTSLSSVKLSTPHNVGLKHSTPLNTAASVKTSLPAWISKLDDTSGSVENLRDATVVMRAPDLSLEQVMRNSHMYKHGSAQKLQPIQETVVQDSFAEMTNNKTGVVKASSDVTNNDNLTQPASDDATRPRVDITNEATDGEELNIQDLEEALNRKVSEVEFMTQLLSEKDEMIENLQDNIEDLQAQLEEMKKTEEANKDVLEKAREDEDKLIEVSNKLIEVENKLQELKDKSFEHADVNLLEELRVLREENQDRIRGMENLHGIIENSQKQIDDKKTEINDLKSQLEAVGRDHHEKVSTVQQQLNQIVQEKNDQVKNLEQELAAALSRVDDQESDEMLQKMSEEKQVVESQLERVTLEMASVQNVVSEMTASFKQQILIKDQEIRKHVSENSSLVNINDELKRKCQELEMIQSSNKAKIDGLERRLSSSANDVIERRVSSNTKDLRADNDNLESGSLEDLSNLVQAELDLSTELDNTLLSQVVTGLDNSGVNTTGVSEIQRLVKKIQGDGIKVLSLSERLFLMQHANVGGNLNNLSSDNENGSKERELERKLELLEFQLKQEKFLAEDLRKSLSHEKKNVLDNLSKVSDERRSRSELETRINHLEHQLETAQDKLNQTEYKLSVRESQLHFNSDSDNEEFLNTIQAQKSQILSLEESLRLERENFAQLQRVLEVERGRGRRHDADDVREMIIKQLQDDLQHERDKLGQHETVLVKEKQRYNDLMVEFEHLKNTNNQWSSSSEVNYKTPATAANTDLRYLRDKNLELERYNSELELRMENTERDSRRLRADIAALEADLSEERAKNVAGMNKDQLSRMQQVSYPYI